MSDGLVIWFFRYNFFPYSAAWNLPWKEYFCENLERVRTVNYTGCNRRNGPDFGRVFLRSNYTDI